MVHGAKQGAKETNPKERRGWGRERGRALHLCLAKIRDARISVPAHIPFESMFENMRSLLWACPPENLNSLPHITPTEAEPGLGRPEA